jgi:integrase
MPKSYRHLDQLERALIETQLRQGSSPSTKLQSQTALLTLLGAITDLRDLTIFSIGVFCGPRSSEAMGLQWKSWNGSSLTTFSIAHKGHSSKARSSQRRVVILSQCRRR